VLAFFFFRVFVVCLMKLSVTEDNDGSNCKMLSAR
jgi:hypothetical protein